jgi:hypothetical protein
MGAISTEQSRLAALRRKVLKSAEQLMATSRYAALPNKQALPLHEPTEATVEHALNLKERTVLLEILLYEAARRIGQSRMNDGKDVHAAMRTVYRQVNERLPVELRTAFPEPVYDEQRYASLTNIIGKLADRVDQDNDFGYIYQFFCTPVRKSSLGAVQKANKSSSIRELVTFTQLYTPDWVVDFLLQNATGIGDKFLVNDLSRPNSIDLKIIDPACGAGHILLKVLEAIAKERVAAGQPLHNSLMDGIRYNLFGADIDAIGLWITGLAIVVKCHRELYDLPNFKLNLALAETGSSLGSLDRSWASNHILGQNYDVVITNPPYLGRKLLSRELKTELKKHYPTCHQDLSAAFIKRGIELLKPGGRLAVITQASVLVLPTYTKLRQQLLEEDDLLNVVNLGPGVFPLQNGEKINSALIVAERGHTNGEATLIDITEEEDKPGALLEAVTMSNSGKQSAAVSKRNARSFLEQPNFTICADAPISFPLIMEKCAPLETYADIRQGLATTDNARFVKWWWQVPREQIGKRWFPYVKGAGAERWWSPIETVVDWENKGEAIKEAVNKAYPYLNGKTAWVVKNEQFYFKPGLTFSFINSRQLALRELPAGCIFDVAGSALFPLKNDSKGDSSQAYFLLSYLNSSFAGAIGRLLNPTINFQVGDLKRIPVLPFDDEAKERLSELAANCIHLKKTICSFAETDLCSSTQARFEGDTLEKLWKRNRAQIDQAVATLGANELEIDSLVLKTLGIQIKDKDQLAEFERLAEKQVVIRPRLANPIASERDFIHAYLTQHLLTLLNKTNKIDIRSVLDEVPAHTLSWVKQHIGSGTEYARGEFAHHHSRKHHGEPRLIVDSESIVISPSSQRI